MREFFELNTTAILNIVTMFIALFAAIGAYNYWKGTNILRDTFTQSKLKSVGCFIVALLFFYFNFGLAKYTINTKEPSSWVYNLDMAQPIEYNRTKYHSNTLDGIQYRKWNKVGEYSFLEYPDFFDHDIVSYYEYWNRFLIDDRVNLMAKELGFLDSYSDFDGNLSLTARTYSDINGDLRLITNLYSLDHYKDDPLLNFYTKTDSIKEGDRYRISYKFENVDSSAIFESNLMYQYCKHDDILDNWFYGNSIVVPPKIYPKVGMNYFTWYLHALLIIFDIVALIGIISYLIIIPLSPLYSSVKILIIGSFYYVYDRNNPKELKFDDFRQITVGIVSSIVLIPLGFGIAYCLYWLLDNFLHPLIYVF